MFLRQRSTVPGRADRVSCCHEGPPPPLPPSADRGRARAERERM